MLGGHQHVDIVLTADTMVEAGQQAVGVGGQIEAHHVGFLVGQMIQEAGILMGIAVVVLLPDVGGQDVV